MATDINNELEFKEHLKNMDFNEKIDWVAKEVFYQSSKLSSIDSRLHNVEDTCKDRGGECKPNKRTTFKYAGYGAAGTLGTGSIIYLIFEIIKAAMQRGG